MPLRSSSSFRCQRDDRRRRLLSDEHGSVDGPDGGFEWDDAPQTQQSGHYGDAAFLERQPRLLDLVPRRIISLAGLLIACAAVIGGLEAAYSWMLNRVAIGGAPVAALDLAAKGSFGCWLSSLLLLAATAAALLTFTVRRHRTDDYQGRYRIWLWAAACWFCMAADQATNLRDAFRQLMVGLTGTPLLGDGELWWVVAYALVLGAIGSRLVMDMRSSRLAMGVFLTATVAQVLAAAGRLGWILPAGGKGAIMFLAGAEMTGSLLLLAAMLIYARHVIFDAEGLLPHHKSKADEPSVPAETAHTAFKPAAASGESWQKVDPPHPRRSPRISGPLRRHLSWPIPPLPPHPLSIKN